MKLMIVRQSLKFSSPNKFQKTDVVSNWKCGKDRTSVSIIIMFKVNDLFTRIRRPLTTRDL